MPYKSSEHNKDDIKKLSVMFAVIFFLLGQVFPIKIDVYNAFLIIVTMIIV